MLILLLIMMIKNLLRLEMRLVPGVHGRHQSLDRQALIDDGALPVQDVAAWHHAQVKFFHQLITATYNPLVGIASGCSRPVAAITVHAQAQQDSISRLEQCIKGDIGAQAQATDGAVRAGIDKQRYRFWTRATRSSDASSHRRQHTQDQALRPLARH